MASELKVSRFLRWVSYKNANQVDDPRTAVSHLFPANLCTHKSRWRLKFGSFAQKRGNGYLEIPRRGNKWVKVKFNVLWNHQETWNKLRLQLQGGFHRLLSTAHTCSIPDRRRRGKCNLAAVAGGAEARMTAAAAAGSTARKCMLSPGRLPCLGRACILCPSLRTLAQSPWPNVWSQSTYSRSQPLRIKLMQPGCTPAAGAQLTPAASF